MPRNVLRRTSAALALGLLALSGPACPQDGPPDQRQTLLLMGTIPIYGARRVS